MKTPITALLILMISGGILSACSESPDTASPDPGTSQPSVAATPEIPPITNEHIEGADELSTVEAESRPEPPDPEITGEEEAGIDPSELEPAGSIELKQYTVAWLGSGTMGSGTLIIDGVEYPFRLAGLGVGGYGASSLDATGKVYNLPNIEAFPGTYGNARLGVTGGDSGSGRLWLRNPDGVVIELESEIRGLALTGGVDGILIQWEDESDSKVDEVMDDTRDTAGDVIEAGADAVQDGVDNVKGWFKKKG